MRGDDERVAKPHNCFRRLGYRFATRVKALMRNYIFLGVTISLLWSICLHSETTSQTKAATNASCRVVVHYGKDVTVTNAALAKQFESDVLELIKSANYNSQKPHRGVWRHPESASAITSHYRDLISHGDYIVVTWAQPQHVNGVVGDVDVKEAIVELEKPGAWMCIVDQDGRLSRLGKFSGKVLVHLEQAARGVSEQSKLPEK
jgi:hypothetical protein